MLWWPVCASSCHLPGVLCSSSTVTLNLPIVLRCIRAGNLNWPACRAGTLAVPWRTAEGIVLYAAGLQDCAGCADCCSCAGCALHAGPQRSARSGKAPAVQTSCPAGCRCGHPFLFQRHAVAGCVHPSSHPQQNMLSILGKDSSAPVLCNTTMHKHR